MRMLRRIGILIAACGALYAQQPVAPTTEQVGSPRGEDKGAYNITNSVEFGYRWRLVGGNLGEYRSDVNYGNGLRLLGGSFTINSKDGHGRYFDQILLNTIGLGNDPYQSATLRVQKNGLYRYDMNWRLNDYYNPGLATAGGLHLLDTVHRLQDHELLLLPQSHYRLRVGYSRNTQDGPALSTAQEFDANGLGLPVFQDVQRRWNEYRVGGDIDYAGFKFTVMRRWDFFTEQPLYRGIGAVSGPGIGVASDPTMLQTFSRTAPQKGRNPGWLGNLLASRKRWAVNARISYLHGHNDFSMGEAATGLDRFGNGTNRQILVKGDAERPYVAGDLNLSFFPTSNLTIVNTTSANSLRISGPSSYTELVNGTSFGESQSFRYLGIRRVTNSTDANLRLNKWFGVYAGFRFTDRLVRTVEGIALPAVAGSEARNEYQNSNSLKSGVFGVRIRPVKPLSVSAEGELGRADNPLTPISDRNYHAINGRVDYRTRRLQLSSSYKQTYNLNQPIDYAGFSSHSRNYMASASWSGRDWFSFDASYVKLHLDTAGGIFYFAGTGVRNTLQSATSLYRSNVHAANLGVRLDLKHRADLYLGYSITKDTGGDRSAFDPVTGPLAGSLLTSVQTFPLTYQSPSARVSVRITPKLRWNAGYQFYNYNERFGVFSYNQDFRANTGYTSVLWNF
jgi:hypothetical protein